MTEPINDDRDRLNELLESARQPDAPARPEIREENLRRLVRAALPPAEVSESLRQRVLALEADPPARRWLSMPRLISQHGARWVVAASLVTACIVGAVLIQPTWVAAQAIRRMEAAVSDVRSARLVTFSVAPDGSRTKSRETWYRDGKWRLNDRSTDQVFANGRLWSYEPMTNRVTVRKASGPFAFNPSGFSLAAMTRDFARWGWRDRIRIMGNIEARGRPARMVTIESAHELSRNLLVVDAATDLPVRSELQLMRDGQWVTQRVIEYFFNETMAARLFEPNFPKSARRFDQDAGRQLWKQRLAQGITRRRVAQRLVVLRDLQVNAQGDVFVLFTAAKSPGGVYGEWEVVLTDEFGTRYLPGSEFQPYSALPPHLRGKLPDWWSGYTFDGERLKGKWWVPLVPEERWRPRRFTLAFHVVPINHRLVPLKQQGKPIPEGADLSIRAAFTVRVGRPAAVLLPEWMPFMVGRLQEWEVPRGQAQARAQYFEREKRDPQRALDHYREVARINDDYSHTIGEPFHDAQLWTTMGELLIRMGRREEARRALERALRESAPGDYLNREAERLLKGL